MKLLTTIVLAAFLLAGVYAALSTRSFQTYNADNHHRLDASSPQLFYRSCKTVLSTMSADQRREFMTALTTILKARASNYSDPDGALRAFVDGKTVASIVTEANALGD